MDDDDEVLHPLVHKIQISGPILASLLLRFSSSPASLHGLLFGHFSLSTPSSSLSDDVDHTNPNPNPNYDSPTPLLTATITSFLSFPSHSPLPLDHSLPDSPPSSSSLLLGWFSARRNTPLRPSLFESTTSCSIIASSSPSFPFSSSSPTSRNISLRPSLFLLLTTPFQDQLIHTHEYKAYQYCSSTHSFEAKTLDIINVGPSFRSHYGSFSPSSVFPLISCELSCSTTPMIEDHQGTSLGVLKKESKDQKELDFYADGFDIRRLGRLMDSGAAHYTAELELLYDKMLAKLEALAASVEASSAKVVEQENHNMKLRLKVAGLE